MADFAYSSGRFTGSQGDGTVKDLSDAGVLKVTEDSGNTFSTDNQLFKHKRAMFLYNTNDRLIGFGYITGQLADHSDGDSQFQMDALVDKDGNDTFFLNWKGESVTPTTTDGSEDEVSLSGNHHDVSSDIGDDYFNGGAGLELSQQYKFGSSTNGDHRGVAFFAENLSMYANYSGSAERGRFVPASGSLMFGRITNWQQRQVTGQCFWEANYVNTPEIDYVGDATDLMGAGLTLSSTDIYLVTASNGTVNATSGTESDTRFGSLGSSGRHRFLLAGSDGTSLAPSTFGSDQAAQIATLDAMVGRTYIIQDDDTSPTDYLIVRPDRYAIRTNDVLFACQILSDHSATNADSNTFHNNRLFETPPFSMVSTASTNQISIDKSSASLSDWDDFEVFEMARPSFSGASGNSSDKIMMDFESGPNSSSGLGTCLMIFGGGVKSTSSRARFFGTEQGTTDESSMAVCTAVKFFSNQDLYSGRQGNIPTSVDMNGYTYGGEENYILVDPEITASAQNSIAIRFLGTIDGGSVNALNFNTVGSTDNRGPLAAFGASDGGNSTSPIEIGSQGNTYLNLNLRGVDSGADNEAFIWRRPGTGTGYVKFTNVASTTRLLRQGSSKSPATTQRAWFASSGRWHGLSTSSKAYVTYVDDLTGNNTTHGFDTTLGIFSDPAEISADSNGNLDIEVTDATYLASSAATFNNDTNGYYEYTTSGDVYQTTNGVDYSIKAYGYHEIIMRDLTTSDYDISGVTVQQYPISANITTSLGGGLEGGTQQEQIAEMWDGTSLRVTEANARTLSDNFTYTLASDSESITAINIEDTQTADFNLTELLSAANYFCTVYDEASSKYTDAAAALAEARKHTACPVTVTDDGMVQFDAACTLSADSGAGQITMDSDNTALTGVDYQSTTDALDLSLFSGDGLSLKAANGFENLPSTVPEWDLNGTYVYSSDADATFTFDPDSDLSNFTFEINAANRTVTLINAGSDLTITETAGSVVQESTTKITVKLEEDYSSDDFQKVRWTSGTSLSDVQSNGTFASVTTIAADDIDDDANTFSFEISHPTADTRIDGVIYYDQYEPFHLNGISGDTEVTLIKMPTEAINFSTTYTDDTDEEILLNTTDNATTVAAISSATANLTITASYTTAGLNPNTNATRLWLRRATETDNWAEAVAKQYVANDYFKFEELQVILPSSDTEVNRLNVTRTSAGFIWNLSTNMLRPDGTDEAKNLSTTVPNTYIEFQPKTNGASISEIISELNKQTDDIRGDDDRTVTDAYKEAKRAKNAAFS